ncbi:n-terminal domain protein [Ichthyophthirius multifiliis]|uniref:N-terminal domain protein n=1 Tax=Ichthyophthirius multifiliis TaxID=5932 RepID=G0QXN0_ICHMU|nr:n-terminal domain protein [Ichthyophthirius multifiliis]EGR30030.1 n-terminal domain protein [Ichthyophthirius multifiliis]|eukprot:XP_004031266.1 n-terminal domain protein [Ichthyophthirius multifiliis]
MEKNQKLIPLTSQLNKQFCHLFSLFEKNKTWTDIEKWLFKIEKALKDYPSPFITDKITLYKRLAQCLNKELPQSVHLASLRVYQQIFKNIKNNCQGLLSDYKAVFCKDLGLFSIGLFPYCKYSGNNIEFFINLIREFYLPVQKELVQCGRGLISCFLMAIKGKKGKEKDQLEKVLFDIKMVIGRRQSFLLGFCG